MQVVVNRWRIKSNVSPGGGVANTAASGGIAEKEGDRRGSEMKGHECAVRDKVSALVRLLFRRRSLPLQDSASKTQARCQPLHAYFSVSALYRFGSVGREPV